MHQGEAGSADPIQEWRPTGPEADAAPAAGTSCATAGDPTPAGTDEQPASDGAAGAANTLSGFQGATTALLSVTTPEEHVVNAPISWEQLAGGVYSDVMVFLLAALPGLIAFVSGVGPITTRALVAVGLSAIMAGLIAVQKLTMTDGLSMRLRAMGQINGGR